MKMPSPLPLAAQPSGRKELRPSKASRELDLKIQLRNYQNAQ